MKIKTLLSGICILSCLCATAQQTANSAYAIVSSEKGKMEWMSIQEIDLSSGQVIRTVFDKAHTQYALVNATSNKKILGDAIVINGRKSMSYQYPTATMVAAAAFDKRHNKLFFAPMRLGDLRWIDLNQKDGPLNVYCLPEQLLSANDLRNDANQFTRMVIAADGNGYALSNDANHFMRFTTGKKTVVTKLGKVEDDPSNKDISIHNRNTWGGDMIADAFGNLYVVSASHHVFKISTKSKVAKHLGSIEGLPANYTTNGAAIDNKGNLIVSSAQSNEGYYKVDLINLAAEKISTQNQVFSCSDLATGSLAFDRSSENSKAIERRIDMMYKQVSVYPNPVEQGVFKVNFNNYEFGKYDIQLVDLSGRAVSVKSVNIGMKGQTENVFLDSRLTKGAYVVNILNRSKKVVSTGKVVVQ